MANIQLSQTASHSNVVKTAKIVVDHADTGDVAATDVIRTGCVIPEGAVIIKAWYFVETTWTGGGSTQIKWGLDPMGSSDDDSAIFVAAVAIGSSSVWADGEHGSLIGFGGVESGDNAETALENAAAATATYHHCEEAAEVILTTSVNTLTAGKMTMFIDYVTTGRLTAIS